MAAGALGCSLSGSGPSVFALAASLEIARAAGEAMQRAFERRERRRRRPVGVPGRAAGRACRQTGSMICISTRGKAPRRVPSQARRSSPGSRPMAASMFLPALQRGSSERRGGTALRGESFQDVAMARGASHSSATSSIAGTIDARSSRDALNFPVRIVQLEKGLRRPRAVSRADVRLQGLRRAHAGAAACRERARAGCRSR